MHENDHIQDIRIAEMINIYEQNKVTIPMEPWERGEADWTEDRIDSIWKRLKNVQSKKKISKVLITEG